MVDATYSNQTFKHILTPSWMLSYVYAAKSYQVIVNGVTGSIAGERPWSWIKIGLLVLLGLIILATWASLDSKVTCRGPEGPQLRTTGGQYVGAGLCRT